MSLGDAHVTEAFQHCRVHSVCQSLLRSFGVNFICVHNNYFGCRLVGGQSHFDSTPTLIRIENFGQQIGSIFVHHSRPVSNILFSKAGRDVFEILFKHQFDPDEVVHNPLFGCVDKPFGTLPNLIDVSVSVFG
jgi:hypothetical protein